MVDVEDVVAQVALVTDGFKPIRDLADGSLARHSPDDALALAHALSRSEVHQARMLATLLLGRLAAARLEALAFPRGVGDDPEWRVQETLAMAFDTYCKGVGYEEAPPTIESCSATPTTPCGARSRGGCATGPTAPTPSSTPIARSRCCAG